MCLEGLTEMMKTLRQFGRLLSFKARPSECVSGTDLFSSTCGYMLCDYVTVLSRELVTLLSAMQDAAISFLDI
jgi:hypothetical protein